VGENASGDVATAVYGLAGMVRTRARKLYREAGELRGLAAQLESAAGQLVSDTEKDTDTHDCKA
jgi:hypothetical protein